MAFSDKALRLILDFEGINQPGKWPGGASGITVGYGYDLGHVTAAEFAADWNNAFTAEEFARLGEAIGKTGAAAKALAPELADIKCTADDSRRVLVDHSIPEYVEQTESVFPGFDSLPLDAQGALVSLVYNRGAGMRDSPGKDNRREMRAIRDLVPKLDLAGIAAQLRSMKRLWKGQGLDGLLRRRDAEAKLVESCIAPAMPRAFGVSAVGAPVKRAGRKRVAAKVRRKRVAPKKASTRKATRRATGRKTRRKKIRATNAVTKS